MDLYSLIVAALIVVSTAVLAMGVVLTTSRTYPGFGWWFSASVARAAGLLLFLLPRDRLSPWLTIVTPNTLLVVEAMFELQGMRLFRGRSGGLWWMLPVGAAFVAVFSHFAVASPDLVARIIVRSTVLSLLTVAILVVMLTRRPRYFGTADVMTALPLVAVIVFDVYIAQEAWRLSASMPGAMVVSTIMGGQAGTLVLIAVTLMATLGQVLMNQQRLAWDQQQVEERLERDLEERRAMERRLRDSEARFRSYFDLPLVGIAVTSLEKGWIDVNDRLCEMLGYSRAELTTMDWVQLTHPDDRAPNLALFEEVLRSDREGYALDKRFLRPDGSVVHAMLGVACVRKEDGRPDYFLSVVQDISERKHMEESLRISEERHRLIAENAHDVVWTMLPDGAITYISPSVETVRGYTPAEAVAQSIDEIHPPESKAISGAYFASLQEAIREGRPLENFRGDLEYKCKDGSTFWTEVMAFPIRRGDGTVEILGVTRDLSQRKLAEQQRAELEAARLRIEKAESLFRMAGAVSHHLNNQLMVVTGYLEMALAKGQDGPLPATELERLLSRSLQAANEAARIGERMSTYFGHTPSERQRVDLAELCSQHAGQLHAMAPAGMTMATDFPKPGPVVLADADLVWRVIQNLVANACEAGGYQPNAVRVVVSTRAASHIASRNRFPIDFHATTGDYACVEVADSAGGIPADQVEKLFDPFYTTKLTGRGLGLAMVLGIVRSHDGVVTVESAPGEGSVFRVYLPLAAREGAELGVETGAAAS